jgi:hypothetical protein
VGWEAGADTRVRPSLNRVGLQRGVAWPRGEEHDERESSGTRRAQQGNGCIESGRGGAGLQNGSLFGRAEAGKGMTFSLVLSTASLRRPAPGARQVNGGEGKRGREHGPAGAQPGARGQTAVCMAQGNKAAGTGTGTADAGDGKRTGGEPVALIALAPVAPMPA